MENDFKAEAKRQFLKYFRIWFIVAAIFLVLAILTGGLSLLQKDTGRNNSQAPTERVYDYAEVLTDAEEDELRLLIAEKEERIKADIVLVTINQEMESDGSSWEIAMMNYADDFYDLNNYGYDKIHGSGVLLLDNHYEGQEGSWLSTCGRVYEWFGSYEINEVLDAVYYGIEDGAYEAYRDYVETASSLMEAESEHLPYTAALLLSAVVALVYALVHLHQTKAKDTTNSKTYVSGGKPVMKVQRDDFIRKSVVTRRIESNSSSGSSGGGGGHRSSSGVSHGGGGRRR